MAQIIELYQELLVHVRINIMMIQEISFAKAACIFASLVQVQLHAQPVILLQELQLILQNAYAKQDFMMMELAAAANLVFLLV